MDSQGNLISENNVPPIYGGSTLKLAGTIYPYVAGGNKGVSLQLAGVQIVELSQGETSSVSFTAEEGGFVAANDNSVTRQGAKRNLLSVLKACDQASEPAAFDNYWFRHRSK